MRSVLAQGDDLTAKSLPAPCASRPVRPDAPTAPADCQPGGVRCPRFPAVRRSRPRRAAMPRLQAPAHCVVAIVVVVFVALLLLLPLLPLPLPLRLRWLGSRGGCGPAGSGAPRRLSPLPLSRNRVASPSSMRGRACYHCLRSAQRRRALLESNPSRNTWLGTHRQMVSRVPCPGAAPSPSLSIDSLMPWKTPGVRGLAPACRSRPPLPRRRHPRSRPPSRPAPRAVPASSPRHSRDCSSALSGPLPAASPAAPPAAGPAPRRPGCPQPRCNRSYNVGRLAALQPARRCRRSAPLRDRQPPRRPLRSSVRSTVCPEHATPL